ncbi:MAG: hypothetical protein PHH93_06385, partial [Prolixibacteraceae bacterium]|nr:hypothetical protein [Prolixibacteraceae bacterium]
MGSIQEKQMLKDFGFQDEAQLQKYLNISPGERYKIYKFRWRLIMRSKYKDSGTSVNKDLIRFHTEYEDYVINHQKGGLVNWPPKAKEQSEYLFERLEKPWVLERHAGILFSIKDPLGNYWFRALNSDEYFEALDICYRESKNNNARVKGWKLSLDWWECYTTYQKKRNNGVLWTGKDYDVALMICDNITSTWDTATGDWKPWNNSWSGLAHRKLTGIKYGFCKTGPEFGGRSPSVLEFVKHHASPAQRNINFEDIANFVFREGLTRAKQAAFILATAFA